MQEETTGKPSKSLGRYRIDFKSEFREVRETEDAPVFEAVMVPDPERYEWRENNGEKILYDKFDNIAIPMSALKEAAGRMNGLPIYFQPPKIESTHEYLAGRKAEIRERLKGRKPSETFSDKSEEFLQSLAVDELGFVIMSVDLVGSTRLSRQLDPKRYATLISTLLWEMGNLIAQFHGHVLKHTGDGVIAYFPEPSFNSQNDNAMDCALSLRALVYETMNPLLKEAGYPHINIRIGMEAGDAAVITIGSPETKQHKDIIGSVVSLAAKIQSKAQPGGISLGETATRNQHISRRKHLVEMKPPTDWPYAHNDGQPYKIYRWVFD